MGNWQGGWPRGLRMAQRSPMSSAESIARMSVMVGPPCWPVDRCESFPPGLATAPLCDRGDRRVARHRVRRLGSAWNTALDTSAGATDGDHWRCVHRADFESDWIGLEG